MLSMVVSAVKRGKWTNDEIEDSALEHAHTNVCYDPYMGRLS